MSTTNTDIPDNQNEFEEQYDAEVHDSQVLADTVVSALYADDDDDIEICEICQTEYLKDKPNNRTFVLIDEWYICSECVKALSDTLESHNSSTETVKVPVAREITPSAIKAHLDTLIVGQEVAKKALAVAAYQNSLRIKSSTKSNVKIQKINTLLIGPTGSGKTALIQALSEYLDVPYFEFEAGRLTQPGYIGSDVEDLFEGLVKAAGGDFEKAQRGIIFLDEIDKIRVRPGAESKSELEGRIVQQGLLKVLEGMKINIRAKPDGKPRHSSDEAVFDTSNVLFFLAGAFVDLPNIIRARVEKDVNTGIGFGATVVSKELTADYDKYIGKLKNEDLVEFGYLPEFVGRFSQLAYTNKITEEIMLEIFKEPANSVLRQHIALFDAAGIEFGMTLNAQKEVSRLAIISDTGARALSGLMSDVLRDILFSFVDIVDLTHITIEFLEDKFRILLKVNAGEYYEYKN